MYVSSILYRLLLPGGYVAAAVHIRADSSISTASPATSKYTIPQDASDLLAREEVLNATRQQFLYGPPVGGGPYYPTGVLGESMAKADISALGLEAEAEDVLTDKDHDAATNASSTGKYDNLRSLHDYTLLYDDEWTHTLPKGPAPGVLTNYSSDLFFSMERLSNSPYAVRRLNPSTAGDVLAFALPDALARALTNNNTLAELFTTGRLFYVNHTAQASLRPQMIPGRYTAACDAYFFVDDAGRFMPLAIRNVMDAGEEELVYTPLDDPEDWTLAKIMFNANDVFWAQTNHLAATHQVVQIAWMAAVRSVSVEHPVYALLKRIMYQAFAVQPIAQSGLFDANKTFDQIFPFGGDVARDFATDLYHHHGSGAFRRNYFLADLERRGLVGSPLGPALAHFPFYEDATVVHGAIGDFVSAVVDAYYVSDADVAADEEMRAWAVETNGPAAAIDFPDTIEDKETLVGILTHMAHLISASHHAVNTNQLQSISMTLPMHPVAFYAPLPSSKGTLAAGTPITSFLPGLGKSISQILVTAGFSRPLIADTPRTLLHMFDDEVMLAGMTDSAVAAEEKFEEAMRAFSGVVAARTFDADGLSQGMPFVWRALDPNVAPFSATI